jgi:hypothetical protein
MSPIHSTNCSADDAALLMKNAWKYVQVGATHVRIHPADSYVPVIPQGPVQYIATVEVLQKADSPWGTADPQCAEVISRLFPAIK